MLIIFYIRENISYREYSIPYSLHVLLFITIIYIQSLKNVTLLKFIKIYFFIKLFIFSYHYYCRKCTDFYLLNFEITKICEFAHNKSHKNKRTIFFYKFEAMENNFKYLKNWS